VKSHDVKVEKLFEAKNAAGIAKLFHPDAILIHRGVRAYYGREGMSDLKWLKL
jgi:hypothetical protein